MFNDQQLIKHHFFRIHNTELNEMYAVMSLRSFLLCMVGLFSSIYLYTLHFSIQEIFLTELIMFSTEAVCEIFVSQIIIKYGPKHSMGFGMPVLAVYYWLLFSLPVYHWPIWFFSGVAGISIALFWQAYHYDFSRSKKNNSASSDVSKLYIFIAVAAAIAPFIGGTIASKFGFQVLLGIATIGFLLAAIPLLWVGEKHKPVNFKLSRLKDKQLGREMMAYAGSGIEGSAGGTIWPLFTFLILGSTQAVGFVTSLALILTVVITYYVGKRGDRVNKKKYIQTGGIFVALSYFARVFVSTMTHVVILNLISNASHSIYTSPFVAEYYEHADENSRAEYLFIMELTTDIARILFFGVLVLLGYFVDGILYLSIGLILGGFGAALLTLMPASKRDIVSTKDAKIRVTPKLRSASNEAN